jgi:hypothetical protein
MSNCIQPSKLTSSSSLLLLSLIIRNHRTLLLILVLLLSLGICSLLLPIRFTILGSRSSGLFLGKLLASALRDGGGDNFTEFFKLALLCEVGLVEREDAVSVVCINNVSRSCCE